MPPALPAGLYAIADAGFGDPVTTARRLAEAGCRTIQLRAKGWKRSDVLNAAQDLAPVLREQGVCFIINDHVEVALSVGADGVHLGQDDASIASARRQSGPDMIIGWSTHDLDQVRLAQGADYIGFGPIYTTGSKVGALSPRGPLKLSEAVETAGCPVVAIGGIGPEVLDTVVATGVHGWACIASLVGTDDLASAVARMQHP